MCDIWKENRHLKQLTEDDITGLLHIFKKLGTKEVVMSGGEALLNPNFFRFCEILEGYRIKVTLLSTGLTLRKNADQILHWVNNVIVSLDGNEETHNRIRNIPYAFQKLHEGVRFLKSRQPSFRITARTVIHRLNFRGWPQIIDAAHEMGIDQISFLPADTTSNAFNRPIAWNEERQHEVLPGKSELPAFYKVIENILQDYRDDFESNYIAESPAKIQNIYEHYAACYDLNPFPYKKCNAPWVSTVVEADGTVRPCFFHEALGNIRKDPLDKILNSTGSIAFRKNLDMEQNDTCRRCVCHLYLSPRVNPFNS